MTDTRTPHDFNVAFNNWIMEGKEVTQARLGEIPPGRVLNLLQDPFRAEQAKLSDWIRETLERLTKFPMQAG